MVPPQQQQQQEQRFPLPDLSAAPQIKTIQLTDSLVVEVEYLRVLREPEPVLGLDDHVVDGPGAEVPQRVG